MRAVRPLGRPSAAGIRLRRRPARAAALATAALVLSACGVNAQDFDKTDPRQAVSQLIAVTFGEANGQKACALLDEAAIDRLDRTLAGSCAAALSNAAPVIPGTRDDPTDSSIPTSNLVLTERVAGRRATVRVTGRGADLTFGLVRLDRGGDGSPLSPATPWRIDSGEMQLLQDVAPSAGAEPPSRPPASTDTPPAGTTTTAVPTPPAG